MTSIVCGNAAWLIQFKVMDKSAFLQLRGHYIVSKYEIVLPEISKVVKAEGKAVAIDREPDYRAELRKLKQALLTWIWMNEDDLTVNSSGIYNRAKTLINLGNVKSEEQELNNLISESEIYISKLSFREKRIGLEKIFDAFERMKTLKCEDKKKSVESILNQISGEDKEIIELLDDELTNLTRIGNSFSIRHHETNQKSLSSIHYIEYFYFRTLSLISLILNSINNDEQS